MISERIGSYVVRESNGQPLILLPGAKVGTKYDVILNHKNGVFSLVPVK